MEHGRIFSPVHALNLISLIVVALVRAPASRKAHTNGLADIYTYCLTHSTVCKFGVWIENRTTARSYSDDFLSYLSDRAVAIHGGA
jgi:hypothetical protein